MFLMVQGGSPSFHKKNVYIWGTKSAQFQSLSCQNLYIYDFGGDKGEAPPCLRKFVFGGLNLHNFRPVFNLTFYKDIGFLGG